LAEDDTTLRAAERLEAAVERLILAIEERLTAPAPPAPGAPPPAGMAPRAELEALAQRLDETLARLRAALDAGEG
jgi:hypothetical protein